MAAISREGDKFILTYKNGHRELIGHWRTGVEDEWMALEFEDDAEDKFSRFFEQ